MIFKNIFLIIRIKIIYAASIFSLVLFRAQDSSFLPEPIKTTTEYKRKGDFEGALKFNTNALTQYEKNGDTKGIIMVYTNIGGILCGFARHKESLEYLDKAKKELSQIKDAPLLTGSLYNEYGRNYIRLGLFEQANTAYNKAEYYIKKITNDKQRNYLLFHNYSGKYTNFLKAKNIDSLRSIEKKMLTEMPGTFSYTRIADDFIAKKHLDSAEYYMNKAVLSFNTANFTEKGIALFSYGDLYNVKGDQKKALEYYLKSEDIFQQIKNKPALLTVYDTVSSVYKSLNEIEKSNDYLRKYTFLNDILNKNEKEAVNLAVNKLLELKHEEKGEERKMFYFIVLLIIISFSLLLYFIRKVYLKKELKKDKLIEKKTIETDVLKLKVNDSFDEIIQLMESRSPLFLTRFKEVYPEFYGKLVNYAPELTEHDIKFSAYLRLNLTNKEICQYENISLRGVETKRYRLKKKLQLAKDTDLQKWILEL